MNVLIYITRKLFVALFLILVMSTVSSAGAGTEETFRIPKLVLKEDRGIGSMFADETAGFSFGSNAETKRVFHLPDRKLKSPERIIIEASNSVSGPKKEINKGKSRYFSEEYMNKIPKDHIYWESQKHFGVAVVELAIVEFIPWALSKWIMKPGWANVGWQSWWNNIQKGWEYDGDNFLTNNFAHPYHGNLYFNTGRTNGYSFWESVPFALTGSLLWEYFGEYYRPSFNDWINTSVSGINLGEMTYRVSNLITDNTTRGSDRVWSEIFGALVNPVRGFNRLISGEATKVHPNTELYNMPLRLFVDGGMRRITKSGSDFLGDSVSTEGLLGFNLLYGKTDDSDLDKPFSRFRVWGHISNGSEKLTDLHSYGLLRGWKLGGKDRNKQTFSLNLAYNFEINPAYEFGGPAVLAMFRLKNMVGKENFIRTDLAPMAILMGSTSTEYFYGEDGRNYDFGPGPGIYLNSVWTNGIWNYVTAGYRGFTIFTMSGSPESKHYLHSGWLGFEAPINNYFALGGEFSVYWRTSLYKDKEDVQRTSPIGRLYFITKL